MGVIDQCIVIEQQSFVFVDFCVDVEVNLFFILLGKIEIYFQVLVDLV